MKQTENMKT